MLDQSIANVALPTIARALHTTPARSVWVVNAYQLAVVSTILPAAALGEIVGYSRVYRWGVAVFTLASLLCALSTSLPELAAARVLQGLGAAGLMGVNGALIRFIYPRAMLGRGIGRNALMVSVSATLGPGFASLVLSLGSWPWLFAVNVPLGLAILALAGRCLPASPQASHRLDLASAGLNALAFATFFHRRRRGHSRARRLAARRARPRGGRRRGHGALPARALFNAAADPDRPAAPANPGPVCRRLGLRLRGHLDGAADHAVLPAGRTPSQHRGPRGC